MKKVPIYAILIVFLFNSMGYYVLFEVQKYMAVKEMQAASRKQSGKMVLLTIPDVNGNKDFQWIHKKEFRFRGEMYDIVREFKSGDNTVFICLHDTKESKLFAGLKRVNHNKLHVALLDHLIMFFLSGPSYELNPVCAGDMVFPRYEVSLISSAIPTWSPPPKHS